MYDSFECGYFSCRSPLLEPYYTETNGKPDVYPCVPRAVLQAYIDKMGGIVGYVSNYRTGEVTPIPLTHQEAAIYALTG